MKEDLKKFEQLLLTDVEFRKKLSAVSAAYKGEQSEEAVFEGVLVPIAAEYGISVTYEEYKEYIESLLNNKDPMSDDELRMIAGGGKGIGATACVAGLGVGVGGGSEPKPNKPGSSYYGGCIVVGSGNAVDACWSEGYYIGT